MLQHPKILPREGKKDEGAEELFKNITVIKYSCSSGILLCSFSIRRTEVEKKKRAPLLVPVQEGRKRAKEKRDLFLLGEKTENRMSGATVDGGREKKKTKRENFLSATTKNRLQTTVREGEPSG